MGRPKGHGAIGDKASLFQISSLLTDMIVLQQSPSIHLSNRSFQREKAATKDLKTPLLSANAHSANSVGGVLLSNGYYYPRSYSRSSRGKYSSAGLGKTNTSIFGERDTEHPTGRC